MVEPLGEVGQPGGDGRAQHPEIRYERRDVAFGPVVVGFLAAGILAVIHFAVIWGFFLQERSREAAIKQSQFPLAPTPSTELPPEPRLEQLDRLAGSNRPEAYPRMEAELEILQTYGPTQEKGYVHIPIDRAMELVVDQLQVRPAEERPAAGKDNGLVAGGRPNSGRRLRGP